MENKIVIVNGKSFDVEIKPKVANEKVQKQQKLAKRFFELVKNNPSIILALISGYISYCGLTILWMSFSLENINLFDYVSVSDLFFGFFAIEYAPFLIVFMILSLVVGLFQYRKKEWYRPWSYWLIAIIYLLFFPATITFFIYTPQPVGKNVLGNYSVEYKVKDKEDESDLILIASLSGYKVFKKTGGHCDKSLEHKGKECGAISAINDSAIASLNITKTSS